MRARVEALTQAAQAARSLMAKYPEVLGFPVAVERIDEALAVVPVEKQPE